MKIYFTSFSSSKSASPWQRFVVLVMGVVLLVLVLMFAAVLLPIVLLVMAYLWWKTRAVRKQLRQMQAQMHEYAQRGVEPQGNGEIIEGEVVRVYKSGVRIER